MGGLSRLEKLSCPYSEVSRAGLAAFGRSVDGLAGSLTRLELYLPDSSDDAGDVDDEAFSRQLDCLGRLTALRELHIHEGRPYMLGGALPRLSALSTLHLCTGLGCVNSAADMDALASAPALADLAFDTFWMVPCWDLMAVAPGVTRLVCSDSDNVSHLQQAFPNVKDLTLSGGLFPLEDGTSARWRGLRRLTAALPHPDAIIPPEATPEEAAAAVAAAAASITPTFERLGALDGCLEELALGCCGSCELGAAELGAILEASPLLGHLSLTSVVLAPGALAACAPHAGLRKLRLDPGDLAVPASDEWLAQLLHAGRAFPSLCQLIIGGEEAFNRPDFRPAAQAWAQQLDARFGGAAAAFEGGEEECRPAGDGCDYSTQSRGLLRAIRGALQREAAAAATPRAPQRGRSSRKQRAR